MNRERRNKLKRAFDLTDEAYRITEAVLGDERTALENTPEGLRESERYMESESMADDIESALDDLATARDSLGELIQ